MTSLMIAWLTVAGLTESTTLPAFCQEINGTQPILERCTDDDIRWRDSTRTIEVKGDVECTLSEIAADVPDSVLSPVEGERNTWYLKARLVMLEGARLKLYGMDAGGDVDELRLHSNSGEHIYIRAEWGSIDIRNTRILSWDEGLGGPDTNHEDGRAFIGVRSFLEDDEPRTSRMDIRDSEIGYLGFYDGESYGLAWRVMGTGDSGTNSPVFDQVEVHGVVHNSKIHHNYMGSYSWGASCMEWVNNDVGDNVVYGIDPHDNSDHLLISGNRVHHNGTHGIICSKNCDHLIIRNNVSSHNGRHGIMLHWEVTDSVLYNNRTFDNGGSGIAIFTAHNNLIKNNDVYRNNDGIHIYMDSHGNLLEGNVVHHQRRYGIWFTEGAYGNTATDNTLFDNVKLGLTSGVDENQTITDNSFDPIAGHDHLPGTDEMPPVDEEPPTRVYRTWSPDDPRWLIDQYSATPVVRPLTPQVRPYSKAVR
ncbi:MAG: right-handed parallel beta-helix repeat-containing protein [Myxococcota bacterium]